MCRIPKVIVVAPEDKHLELRKALSSLEYDVVATVASAEEATDVSGDVAVCWEPDEDTLTRLRKLGLKTVALSEQAGSADMSIDPADAATFKSRVWELFRSA